jgi:hypothetical protein
VRKAEGERSELIARYDQAYARAAARGASAQVTALETALAGSWPVVNMDLEALLAMMLDNEPYSTYRMQVEAGVRGPASGDRDMRRASVDAILFGTNDRHIRYAALALGVGGLTSYGAFGVVLRESAVADRASLLDENAFDFVRRHEVGPFKDAPEGYVSTWSDRSLLAVAKLADAVDGTTVEAAFPDLLLWTEGDRETDRFVEVHIFGSFGRYAVSTVRGTSKGLSPSERAKLMAVEDFLASTGGAWIDS